MLKKIGVFGGTGMTGQCVVNAAVEKGNSKKETLIDLVNNVIFFRY